jgi:hypothetical protein
MARWFVNHAKMPRHAEIAPSKIQITKKPRPRATTGVELFAKDQKEALHNKLSTVRAQLDVGGLASGTAAESLALYHSVRAAAYANLSSDEQAKWTELAATHNETIKNPPPLSHIYESVCRDLYSTFAYY